MMFDDLHQPTLPSVRDQAMAWKVRLQSGHATPADRLQFEQWISADPMHQQEFEQAVEVWDKLDHVSPLLVKELAEADIYWSQHRDGPSTDSVGWKTHGGHVVSVMGFAALMIGLLLWWQPFALVVHESYQTAKGEQRTIHLADGSTILMNTDSQLSVRLSTDERRVTLKRGEALFTVAHDSQRPFDVYVANGVIHDIGTEFLVRQSSVKVNVAVLEGEVEVALNHAEQSRAGTHPTVLRQGEHLFYTAQGRLSAVEPFNEKATAAWAKGKLVFVEKSLKDVLKEWSRYRADEIRIDDPKLRDLPISGTFHLDNIKGFLQALEDTFSIRVVSRNENLILLARQPHL
ncbi:FecR family protein [Candidatus Nitrospira salsa]